MEGRDNRDQNRAQGKSSDSQGSRSKSGGMSREEAGHLGGTAPHRCRGLECQKEESSSRSRRSSEEE
jgi:hypothetical protein